jgi:hypothetical protein
LIRFGKQITENELKEIKAVIRARIAAFNRDDAGMGYTILIKCEIDPLDKTLVQIRPSKVAFRNKGKRQTFIKQLSKKRKPSRAPTVSDWAEPAFLMPKPNGGWRLITDFRLSNQMCRDWKMPLSAIEVVFQKLGNPTLFYVIDITKGFWNLSPQNCANTRPLSFATLGSLNIW